MSRFANVRVQRLPHAEYLPLPCPETALAAGLDLRAAIPEAVTLERGERALLPTGFAFAIPLGFEGQVRARSGLALKHGLAVLNAPGTIDPDYRGEVKVLLINLGQQAVSVEPGDRIAQLVIAPVAEASLIEVPTLEPTTRTGGFGSTGVQ